MCLHILLYIMLLLNASVTEIIIFNIKYESFIVLNVKLYYLKVTYIWNDFCENDWLDKNNMFYFLENFN